MIDYSEIFKKHPWIVQKNQHAILSPDCDGFLCGLFMSKYFNWNVAGYYDGKVLIVKNGLVASDCIFIDMEIFRKHIRSLGHHMVLFNKKRLPPRWDNYHNCIQPNNIRNYDGYNDFHLKYPFGSIHLLLAIAGEKQKIDIPINALCPLFYADGVFKNLFNYPENCLSWIEYLDGNKPNSPLNQIFLNKHYTISNLMNALNDFFNRLSQFSSKSPDKLKISNSKGEVTNLERQGPGFRVHEDERNKVERFLTLLAGLTGWDYEIDRWAWDSFDVQKFKKGNIKPSNARYDALMKQNPLSLAMTSSLAIEYTLERPEKLR
jgi:hypothetical protein